MEDAECVARQVAATIITERGFDSLTQLRLLSSDGSNFTSALFQLTVKKNDGTEIKLFAKVAIVSEKLRELMNAELMFSTERLVYCELAKIYDDIQTKQGVELFRFPEMFACGTTTGRETVVLEDLTAKGYETPQRKASVNWRFASTAVSKLASFHALSFAFEKEHPEQFKIVIDKLQHKDVERDDSTKQVMMRIIKNGLDVVKDEYKGSLAKILGDVQKFSNFRKPIMKTVLIHGDYRPSNMLCKEKDNNLDVVVVDYQTVHSGCPVADLLYFIFLGTDQEFRRRHYDELIEYYYEELVKALRKLGVDEEVYTKEVYLQELKEMIPNALRMSVVTLPIVMVDEDSAPKVSGDADASQFAIAPSQGFASRFSELVEDCAKWGAFKGYGGRAVRTEQRSRI